MRSSIVVLQKPNLIGFPFEVIFHNDKKKKKATADVAFKVHWNKTNDSLFFPLKII